MNCLKTRHLRFATNRPQILAEATGRSCVHPNLVATLEYVRQESCSRNCRLRFSGCGDSTIPGALCFSRHGSGESAHCPLQRDCASDCRLDTAAVSGSDPERPFLSVPAYQFLIHDRDAIFSSELDEELKRSFGLTVLRTPARAPKANAFCERLLGTVRRE
jgi:hypothetical protein